MKNKKKM